MMLESILASAMIGLPPISPAWGQAQPDPLPKGVIQELTLERPNWTTNTSFGTMEFSPDGQLPGGGRE